jgi:hypothetical protein
MAAIKQYLNTPPDNLNYMVTQLGEAIITQDGFNLVV